MRLFSQLLAGLLFCVGCAHRAPITGLSYSLEEKSGYALLVPSLATQTSDSDFQTTVVTLPGGKQKSDSRQSQRCYIHGAIFSLDADDSDFPNKWVVKSLSQQGWARRGGELNFHAEWNRFVQSLFELEHQACFPRKQTLFAMRRAIAESMSLPATETAFFLYSFGGTDFVNLAPGMEIKMERPFMQRAQSTGHSGYGGSLEAYYRVTAASDDGVALHLSRTANQKGARSTGATGMEQLFDLSNRFRSKSMLRLFLQSVGAGTDQSPAILIGANTVSAIERATDQIEKHGQTHCPENNSDQSDCLLFGAGTAVSLMSSVTINGKIELLPFGTSVGYIVDTASSHVLETVSLSRSLASGGYAEVRFPRTRDAVQQLVLLPGDRLAWK